MASDGLGSLVEDNRELRVSVGLLEPPEMGKSSVSMGRRTCISIVDDDESCREALHALLKAYDYEVQIFCTAEELLASSDWLGSACLVVDATLPGASGPELQDMLARRHNSIPVIFVSGYDDPELKERVVAAGAVDCLCKPYEEEALLASLQKALGERVTSSPRAAP